MMQGLLLTWWISSPSASLRYQLYSAIRQGSLFTLPRKSKHPHSTLLRKINCPRSNMSTTTLSSDPDMELAIRKMSLESSVAPSYSFAQSWAKLSDELRLAVLIAVLAQDYPIDHPEHEKLLEILYMPLLLTANAAIATEAFSAHNVFKI
ncbi:hypothetical protein DPSP01_013709 [Paraphaeosphaeria sporulosa]